MTKRPGFSTLAGVLLLPLAFFGCEGENAPDAEHDHADEPAQTADAGDGQQIDEDAVNQVHEVLMAGDVHGYFYDPEQITIRQGDLVRWVMHSGAPHNVAFEGMEIPEGAEEVLRRHNVFVGPEYSLPGQTWEIHFTEEFPAGSYEYICQPHQANDMIGWVHVEPAEGG